MRQPLLVLALALSAGVGTASPAGALAASATKNAPPPPPRYSNPTNTAAPQPPLPNAVSGAAIVQSALKYLGYRYTITGTSPSTGFSCIGLISYVYRQNGITLPGDLQNALNYAPAVPFSQLLPGDILYFQNTIWTGLSHAGIYLGGGKFVHAEWYNRGVVISSFNDDPVDGSYWTKKYLGANRPWMGVAVGPVIPPVSAAPGPSAALTAPSVVVTVAGASPALVTQSLLNVRLSPSMNARVQQVIRLGASLTVIGQRNGWYKVQLTDGTIGWVIAQGISIGAVPVQQSANPTVGTVSQPIRQGQATQPQYGTHVTAKVNGLRVHSAPAIGAPVVNSLSRGQHAVVLARNNGWVKVQLDNGSAGWVRENFTAHHLHVQAVTSNAPSMVPARTLVLTVVVRLRLGPSGNSQVVAVATAGTRVQLLGSRGQWVLVRLPTGVTGYVFTSSLR